MNQDQEIKALQDALKAKQELLQAIYVSAGVVLATLPQSYKDNALTSAVASELESALKGVFA